MVNKHRVEENSSGILLVGMRALEVVLKRCDNKSEIKATETPSDRIGSSCVHIKRLPVLKHLPPFCQRQVSLSCVAYSP